MAETLSLKVVITKSVQNALRMIRPSLPFGGLWAAAMGGLVWAAVALPDGGAGFVSFSILALATLFAHSLYSVSMYHAVLPAQSGVLKSAWVLTLAWLLMIVVVSIGASIIVLFFSLIGSSLGAASGEAGQDITDMAAQMRESGTFWPLFAVFVATLFGVFWFAVRMMLFAASSATRGSVHVFRTWYWTKGHFRTLGPAMMLLIVLPIAGFASAAAVIAAPVAIPALNTAAVSILMLPTAWLGHGFAAAIYDRLAPERAVDDT